MPASSLPIEPSQSPPECTVASRLAYEPPTLVELGTLKDLTAAGSFIDPT